MTMHNVALAILAAAAMVRHDRRQQQHDKIEVCRQQIAASLAAAEAVLKQIDAQDQAGDGEPWERPTDWWKEEPDAN